MTIHGNKSFDTVEHSRFELWEIDQMITDLDKAGYAVVSKEGGSVEHLEGLLDEATSANESLRARNEKLEQRILELSWLAQDAKDQPLTLDSLREAWENAEPISEDNPANEGDELIAKLGDQEEYSVAPAEWDRPEFNAGYAARVLHRAPRREPWQDLADVLGQYDLDAVPDQGASVLARHLHRDGVRVAEGDESNE